MKVLDLFSGIGGFSLGLERAGMETVAFCEFDKHARKVLAKHWHNVPIHDDVRELDGTQYRGSIDVVCGGYPCQPFSTAGKRRGQEDDRHLWPEFLRIIKESQPGWALCENVAGHITMGLDSVLSDLEAEGYTCKTFIIPAVAVDAPHRRDRVWILASNSEYMRSPEQKREYQRAEVCDGSGSNGLDAREVMANTNGVGCKWGGKVGDVSRSIRLCSGEGGDEIKNLSGAFRGWEVEPRVGRVVDGFPGRVDRIKRLGNAVVPQIPEAIGRAIMECENAG